MSDARIAPEDVHQFWFADALQSPQAAAARSSVWFGTSAAFDAEIRTRFEPAMRAAARGELSGWERAARSCVSLVILLDQFPRNAYRNTADAFAYDALALGVTRRAVAARYLDVLSVPERAFLLMPFQHVEDLASQHEGLALFDRVVVEAAAEWRAFAENTLDFARRHLQIIERFGRFPYRNAVLGRTSTEAELEYLASKPQTFGQGTT